LRDEIRQEAYNIIERCTKSGNDDGDSNMIDVDNTITNAELLVDKYAPKLYTDLLSDDVCVFMTISHYSFAQFSECQPNSAHMAETMGLLCVWSKSINNRLLITS